MTDQFHSLTVVLDKNIRTDDVAPLMAAIAQLRGVTNVSGHVVDFASHMAEARARTTLGRQLLKVIYPDIDNPAET